MTVTYKKSFILFSIYSFILKIKLLKSKERQCFPVKRSKKSMHSVFSLNVTFMLYTFYKVDLNRTKKNNHIMDIRFNERNFYVKK